MNEGCLDVDVFLDRLVLIPKPFLDLHGWKSSFAGDVGGLVMRAVVMAVGLPVSVSMRMAVSVVRMTRVF
jgi:hypothetical protein